MPGTGSKATESQGKVQAVLASKKKGVPVALVLVRNVPAHLFLHHYGLKVAFVRT